ncbi:hypothetical protein B0A50_04879 [Salinomyces thailandicus]|uniref:Coenzyme Q-binding protein COQ10 START domain-containing protein n=1 Tax=Salinomyces thailandicus TaxID=706561 RepID=A0A4U0TZ61_9PEZI|nr:hypothetical protein B0A50_04879 [Salinomyces thailandica]
MQTVRPLARSFAQSSTRSAGPPCRAALLAARTPQWTTPISHSSRRNFVSNPFAGPQTLTASRTLQYPSKLIYAVISDVGSYSTFLPWCQGSVVSKTSQPAADGKTYPEEAKLVVGFNGDVSEEFTSRVYCLPGLVVEAVSGSAETTLGADEIPHHSARPASVEEDASRKDTVMTHLLTRWTLKPYPYKPPPMSATHPDTTHKNHDETSDLLAQEKTEVNLNIEYQFANPVYGALSSAAAPKVAEKMIEAFEKRVKSVIEGPGTVADSVKTKDGVLSSK